MTQKLYDPYASHLPALCYILGRLSIRTILEVGSGFYSTSLFHALSSQGEVEHFVLESDSTWAKCVADFFNVVVWTFDVHQLPNDVAKRTWDLAFIDCLVESTRAKHAIRLKGKAKVIVLHDSNPDWDEAYGYSKIISLWKYSYQFTQTYPHTLVLTDRDDAWKALGLQPA